MTKKVRKFKPFKIPRYLKYSVPEQVWKSDLKEFNKHRYKVFTAETKTDDRPPKMNPYNYLNVRRLADDAARLKQIDKENKQLLKAINVINRTTGKVDTYNPHAYAYKSRWAIHAERMKRIEKHNKEIYDVLKSVVTHYSLEEMNEFWRKFKINMKTTSKFPLYILEKRSLDKALATQPSISGNLDKIIVERPLCFLEFKVADGPILGRVIVELYFDHVPVTVQNFAAMCQPDVKLSYKNCVIHRIVPGQFCETGDITKGNGRGGVSIYGESFPEEHHVLNHTRTGVLSMVRIKRQENNSKFCITFGPMEKLDKMNVVFGKIVHGADNLMKVEGYGRKIGKPLAKVIISNCGPVRR